MSENNDKYSITASPPNYIRKIFAELSPFSHNIALTLIHEHSGKRWIARPEDIIMSSVTQNSITSPSLTMNKTEAQELMDQLWRCGIRPSEGSGSAGSLAATEKHLNDMRKLVFHAIDTQ